MQFLWFRARNALSFFESRFSNTRCHLHDIRMIEPQSPNMNQNEQESSYIRLHKLFLSAALFFSSSFLFVVNRHYVKWNTKFNLNFMSINWLQNLNWSASSTNKSEKNGSEITGLHNERHMKMEWMGRERETEKKRKKSEWFDARSSEYDVWE